MFNKTTKINLKKRLSISAIGRLQPKGQILPVAYFYIAHKQSIALYFKGLWQKRKKKYMTDPITKSKIM